MQNAIPLHKVVSSQISAIGYDPASNTLAIQFLRKGLPAGVYNYADVPQDLYDRFSAAESKGIFFGKEIKDAKVPDPKGGPGLVQKYPFTKMDD